MQCAYFVAFFSRIVNLIHLIHPVKDDWQTSRRYIAQFVILTPEVVFSTVILEEFAEELALPGQD